MKRTSAVRSALGRLLRGVCLVSMMVDMVLPFCSVRLAAAGFRRVRKRAMKDEAKAGRTWRCGDQNLKFTPARTSWITRSEEPWSVFAPPASVIAPSALFLERRHKDIRLAPSNCRQRRIPSRRRRSNQLISGSRCGPGAGRRGASHTFRVAPPGKCGAAGDVSKIAIRSDADARTNGCQEISCERLRDGERVAVAQRVGVVAEIGIAVEIVEIAF